MVSPAVPLQEIGYLPPEDIARIDSILERSNDEEARCILREFIGNLRDGCPPENALATLRATGYKLKLGGGPAAIEAQSTEDVQGALARRAELPGETTKLSPVDFHRARLIQKTSRILRLLAEMDAEDLRRELSFVKARYLKLVPDIIGNEYFGKGRDGKAIGLKMIEESNTPTWELLNLIAYVEQLEETGEEECIHLDTKNLALEFLIKRFLTSDPESIATAKRILTAESFIRLLSQMTDTIDERGGQFGGKAFGWFIAEECARKKTPEYDQKIAARHGVDVDDEIEMAKFLDKANPVQAGVYQETISRFIGANVFGQIMLAPENAGNPKIAPALAAASRLKAVYARGDSPEEGVHERIDAAVRQLKFPEHLKRQVIVIYKELYKYKRPVAVRSSSLLEDGRERSFAGKYRTILVPFTGNFERDLEKVLEAVLVVGGSIFSQGGLEYRQEHGLLEGHDEKMGILFQVHHDNDASGVGHTRAHPSYGTEAARGAISFALGHGEGIVQHKQGVHLPIGLLGAGFEPEKAGTQNNVAVLNDEAGEIELLYAISYIHGECDGHPWPSVPAGIRRATVQDERKFGPGGKYYMRLIPATVFAKDPVFGLQNEYLLGKIRYLLGIDQEVELAYIWDDEEGQKEWRIAVVQSRPQHIPEDAKPARRPKGVKREDIFMEWDDPITGAAIEGVNYVFYVDEEVIHKIDGGITPEERDMIQDYLGHLNERFKSGGDCEGMKYIIMSPGRFGSGDNTTEGIRAGENDYTETSLVVEMIESNEYSGASGGSHEAHRASERNIIWTEISPKKIPKGFLQEAPRAQGIPTLLEYFQGKYPGGGETIDRAARISDHVKMIGVHEAYADSKDGAVRRERVLNCAQDDVGTNKGSFYFSSEGINAPEVIEDAAA